MESVQSIKRRLKSINNIGQITKAMELVAATKMRKSQEIALNSRAYSYAALDLLARLSCALTAQQADIAMAMAPELQDDGSTVLRPQPVFCLMRTSLADSLQSFMESGGRKIGAWTASHKQTKLAFDAVHDEPRAFANTNTLSELHDLEQI